MAGANHHRHSTMGYRPARHGTTTWDRPGGHRGGGRPNLSRLWGAFVFVAKGTPRDPQSARDPGRCHRPWLGAPKLWGWTGPAGIQAVRAGGLARPPGKQTTTRDLQGGAGAGSRRRGQACVSDQAAGRRIRRPGGPSYPALGQVCFQAVERALQLSTKSHGSGAPLRTCSHGGLMTIDLKKKFRADAGPLAARARQVIGGGPPGTTGTPPTPAAR